MKRVFLIGWFCLIGIVSFAQSLDLVGLKARYAATNNDSLRLAILDSLTNGYSEMAPDSSIYYADKEIELARKMGQRIMVATGMNMKAYALLNLGNYPASLRLFLEAIDIVQDPTSEMGLLPPRYRQVIAIDLTDPSARNFRLQILSYLYFNLGILYENVNNPEKALSYYKQALRLGEKTGNDQVVGVSTMCIGRVHLARDERDSALIYEQRSHELFHAREPDEYLASSLLNLGRVYLAIGQEKKAVGYFHEAIRVGTKFQYRRGVIAANLLLADIHRKAGRPDSALYYLDDAKRISMLLKAPDLSLRVYNAFSAYYLGLPDNDSAVRYLQLVVGAKDSLFNAKQAREFQNVDFDARQRKQEIEQARKDYRDQWQKYILLSGLAVFLVIVLILWQNNRQKQRAYQLVARQKEETEQQKERVEQTLDDLKRAQAQLLQKEKMASLGELTAGIAHEIQNPLNFVNNFAEINVELVDDLQAQLDARNYVEARTLSEDIKANEDKISHHGKRAAAIVENMLQHSRGSSGEKELTDINALCDEYLRLAFQGFRARDENFRAECTAYFDETIPDLPVVPQDIGRVILNLANNAFQAVVEKSKVAGTEYSPGVTMSTGVEGKHVFIRVEDNGPGIPAAIADKIFQPFFTTKPTGHGTGLGLSLSYDIIKSHGGELRLDAAGAAGSRFIIVLPI